jgi:methanogenic corrinoid protein MtbC1
MKATMEAFRNAGIRNQFKIMVGGAPVTKTYADSIGADGFGENASVSVELALKLLTTGDKI